MPIIKCPKAVFTCLDIVNISIRLGVIIFCCLLMISCGTAEKLEDLVDNFIQEPDAETIRATIKTAVPLTHVAAVAMEAVQGETLSGVIFASTCSTYPCLGLVLIDVDPNNLPFDCNTIDEVLVAGLWSSRESAILTVSFIDAYAGVPTFPVSKISTFPVVKSTNPDEGYTMVYANIDINIDIEPDDTIDLNEAEIQAEYDRLDVQEYEDVELYLSMDAWVVKLYDASTPTDYIDDRYDISGGGQYIGVISNASTNAANVTQIALARLLISHDCAFNPIDGFAVINELGVSTGSQGGLPVVATALLGWDATCNGEGQVLLATGNYILSNGSSISMNLNE